MVTSLPAVLLALAGLALLRARWAGHLVGLPGVRTAGWALVAGAFLTAILVLGPAHGVPVAAGVTTLVAWALVVATIDRRARQDEPVPRGIQSVAPAPVWFREGARLLLVVGVCGVVAGGAALATGRLLFTGAPAVLAWAILLFPLLWGTLATLALMDARLLRTLAVLGAVGAGAGLVLAA